MSSSSGSSSSGSLDRGIGSISSLSSTVSTDYMGPVQEANRLRHGLIDQYQTMTRIADEIGESGERIDQKRLEAERQLLMETLKGNLIIREFRRNHINHRLRLSSIGTVQIYNVRAQEHNHFSAEAKYYYLCALIGDSTMFLSEICQADSKGFVDFNIDHTFFQQPIDFEIQMRIYVLTKKNQKSWKKCLCWLSTNTNEESEDNARRVPPSLFKLDTEFRICRTDVNRTHEVTCVTYINVEKLFFDISATVDASSFFAEGWLDVSTNGFNFEQRWCRLRGTTLSCFNRPIYDSDSGCAPKAGIVIDLKYCRTVLPAGPLEEAVRNNVLVLEMEAMYPGPFTYHLATYSSVAFNMWQILSRMVPTLQNWKDVHCPVVSSLSES